ncbi:nucleotidyl transferase AbiEii/AbiGii toxin family protein [Candidatus Gottesmanbacteria bacterium]|nr:nucleotidyl transferase AbiEii/AbiGii toxin family protein [Candidatus Gottesmanbacteria bacterium]
MRKWSEQFDFKTESRFNEVVYSFNLIFSNNAKFKVDFGYYPYELLEKRREDNGLLVDSFKDIAVNKLLTINQRTSIKDFVDLYFLLQKDFTVWDLIYGKEAKFKMETDILLLAEDFLKVEDFETLPRMIKPLTLEELKNFFRNKAKELGRQATE